MTENTPSSERAPSVPSSVDPTAPHSARVWNYWLGGKDNYAADREAGEQFRELFPHVPEFARQGRGFLKRAVTYLAREAGIRQFLDRAAAVRAPLSRVDLGPLRRVAGRRAGYRPLPAVEARAR